MRVLSRIKFMVLIVYLCFTVVGCRSLQNAEPVTNTSSIESLDREESQEVKETLLPKINLENWLDSVSKNQSLSLDEDQVYYEVEEVAAYIHQFHHLPKNYIKKQVAEERNWSTADNYHVIGGDRFSNREGQLPKKKGRQYFEADIQAGYSHHRGSQRLVYSNDGLIFYTSDHYDSFEQLY